ncbi:MAG: DUF4412 domain-containing protein [Deltaproteobacteria bacterium]|jgi:hypothetical protein|nr:DUF4412 domain-containing protein [Deltaproteobacteria bacterium]MCW9049969.1 DUF4412 domain-containing protein [Deltaproteobacteria bacterium]
MNFFSKVMLFGVFLTLLALPCFSATIKQPQNDYSADFLMKVTQSQSGETMTIPGKVYYSKGKERREAEIMGRKSISIRRDDKKILWTLVPEQRMYLENPLDDLQQKTDPTAVIYAGDMEMTKLGQEKVNGVMTDKYRMLMTNPQAEPMEGFLWLSMENVPIRVEGTSHEGGEPSHFVIDTSKLEFARQPGHLFEVPPGFQRMQTPMFGGGGFPAGKGTMQPDAPPPVTSGMDIPPEQLEQFRLQMEQLKKQMGVK